MILGNYFFISSNYYNIHRGFLIIQAQNKKLKLVSGIIKNPRGER